MRPTSVHLLAIASLLALPSLAGCPDDLGEGTPTPGADTRPADPGADTVGGADTAVPTEPDDGTLTLSDVVPARGLASGLDQVELFGTGFRAGMQVFFGESLAQDTFVLNSRRIVVLTPPRSPGLVDVRVVEPETGVQTVLSDGFLYFNPVEILAVDPPSGHVFGGEPITISGTGFRPGSVVVFGTQAAVSIDVQDDSTILAVTPAGVSIGSVNVHVSNSLGVGTLRDGFLYVDAPRVDSIVPMVGHVDGGNVVDIKGAGFHPPMTVLFGAQPGGDLQAVSPAALRVVAPPVTAPGSVDLVVSSAYGTTTIPAGYTYLDDLAPGTTTRILAVTPPFGPASGGTRATVVAKGLTTKPDTSITIGGAPAAVLTVDAAAHIAVVEVPAGAVGAADVVLSNAYGTDTLAAGYRYDPFVRVYEVEPNFGPIAGGTPITVRGEGFVPGLQVRVGALPASSVTVVDSETVTAVTPPGSPGLANITVLSGGLADTLVGGFSYQADLDLWVVSPPQGAQAGGTTISLIGSGFPADARVRVGDRLATHVTVASPTLITAKTPPGAIGTVDVAVTSELRGEARLRDAFTYYDPQSGYGGTWGQHVDGDVNVTVLNGANGAPIPDAFVMLWTDPQTPYQGFTNLQGQITFSGPDLMGDQMVSASKEGFSSASVVEYDATNVTVFLMPTEPPSPGEPPAVEPAFYRGKVLNLGKSVPIPWGQCAGQPNAPPPMCQTCTTDLDCGAPGYRCSDVPTQGKRCTRHCATSANCPSGFMCYPLHGVVEHQCVPSAGEVTAFCDFSNPHIFAQDLLPDPGIEVRPDMTFEIPLRFGEIAVYCWGGIINRAIGQFTPYALGVRRHVMSIPGAIIEGDIDLAHPLNTTHTIRLDDVPRGPEGPDINVLWRWIDLGSDGVIEFLGQVDSFGTQPFTLNRFIHGLTGNLYDASLTFMGGSFALSANFLPYTLTLHQGIKQVENDLMYYLEDGQWVARHTGVTNNVHALWNASPGDTIGVGTEGLVIRSLGTAWGRQASGVSETLRGVHAVDGGTPAVAVGDRGSITAWNGFSWSKVNGPTTADLRDVWLASPDVGFAVGFYTVLRWNGSTWTTMLGNTSRNLHGVWGFSPTDVWAVGTFGQIIRFNGSTWSTVQSGTNFGLRAVWGSAPDDVWFVGEGGAVLHYNGEEVLPMAVDTTQTLSAIWGESADSVWIAGSRGVVFHWDGSTWSRVHLGGDSRQTNLLAVGGDPGSPVVTGAHELILGPILAVPERVKPGNGGIMGDEYRISWEHQPGPDPHFSYVEVAIPGMFGPEPEWTMINDWYVNDILLPDFPSIEGTPGISPGAKLLTIFRVYKEGFNIDNYSYQDLSQLRWRSWSVHQVGFTKQ